MGCTSTPREIIRKTLLFQHPERLGQDLWISPWAWLHHEEAARLLQDRFPSDLLRRELLDIPGICQASSRLEGDQWSVGTFTDEWGCVFENIQAGVHGEVKRPLIDSPADWQAVEPPYEILPSNPQQARDRVNRLCAESDRFVIPPYFPRLWERYQFIRGSEDAFCDLLEGDPNVDHLLNHIHSFYLKQMEFWASTEVDGLMLMDDWGSQESLLIHPELWRQRFKPFYREYCELAKSHGKFVFMHSDGQIADIYPDLVEVGVDAINSQLFCMDLERLRREVKGKITFWGEIDRQHVLPSGDPEAGRKAVRELASTLYDPSGGILVQFEFGPGAKIDTALAVMDEWRKITA